MLLHLPPLPCSGHTQAAPWSQPQLGSCTAGGMSVGPAQPGGKGGWAAFRKTPPSPDFWQVSVPSLKLGGVRGRCLHYLTYVSWVRIGPQTTKGSWRLEFLRYCRAARLAQASSPLGSCLLSSIPAAWSGSDPQPRGFEAPPARTQGAEQGERVAAERNHPERWVHPHSPCPA